MKIGKSFVERIEEAMADANAFIDKRAAEIAKECPGVPVGSIRNSIATSGCACASALNIARQLEKEIAA